MALEALGRRSRTSTRSSFETTNLGPARQLYSIAASSTGWQQAVGCPGMTKEEADELERLRAQHRLDDDESRTNTTGRLSDATTAARVGSVKKNFDQGRALTRRVSEGGKALEDDAELIPDDELGRAGRRRPLTRPPTAGSGTGRIPCWTRRYPASVRRRRRR